MIYRRQRDGNEYKYVGILRVSRCSQLKYIARLPDQSQLSHLNSNINFIMNFNIFFM